MSDHSQTQAAGGGKTPVTLGTPVNGTAPRLLLHDRSETVSNFLRTFGVWQRPITAFLINYLQEGDVFVDVGANIGYFSVYAGLKVGAGGRVHAVEPDAVNAGLLTENLALNGLDNVRLHRTAVADFCGEATFFHGGHNAGAHSLVRKDELSAGPKVPVVTLDRLLADEAKIKLMKIDVQGAELAVLRGLRERLADPQARPGIILEFSPLDLQRGGELDALLDFIAAHHYSLRAFIANERSSTKPPQIRRATLRQIAEDFIEAKDDSEFDLLLLPHP